MLKSKQMHRIMIIFLIGFILMQLFGCNIRKASENISDSTDLDSSLPTTQSGKTETFIYADLKLEITNVQDVRVESMVDDGGNPWEYKVFICYPGARATILDADMSDANFSADGKPHANWGIELVSDERIRIVDDTDSFEITPDIVGIYNLESSLYVIKFETMENEKVIIQ